MWELHKFITIAGVIWYMIHSLFVRSKLAYVRTDVLEQVDPLEQNRLCTKKDPANEDQYATSKESLKKKEEKIDT